MINMGRPVSETGEAGGVIARTVDNATGEAHKAIDRASDAARPAIDSFAAGAHKAVDRFAGAATQAADTLDIKGAQVRDAQSRFAESCRLQVREKPITSIGVAVAAGFLLSWLLSRR
ncbi:MAG: hypothetical protein ABI724_01125 [Betaproteobacteria bacterium]